MVINCSHFNLHDCYKNFTLLPFAFSSQITHPPSTLVKAVGLETSPPFPHFYLIFLLLCVPCHLQHYHSASISPSTLTCNTPLYRLIMRILDLHDLNTKIYHQHNFCKTTSCLTVFCLCHLSHPYRHIYSFTIEHEESN